jgi:hypothetical protein
MPNHLGKVAAEGMPTFNRSEIMKAAWATWNAFYDARPHLVRGFEIEEFGFYLSVAWRNAREAAMTAKARRAASIRREIDALKFKPFRINIEPRRRALEAELALLAE